MTFKDIFPGLSRSWNFFSSKKIQDFPGGVGILYEVTDDLLMRGKLSSTIGLLSNSWASCLMSHLPRLFVDEPFFSAYANFDNHYAVWYSCGNSI